MVYLRVQSIICLELQNKVKDSFHKKCNWDSKLQCIGKTLENAAKNGLKNASKCKIWLIKKEK